MYRAAKTRAILIAAVTGFGLTSAAGAAITVTTTSNADTMVNTMLGNNSGITVTPGTATFTGGTNAAGTFTGANFLGSKFTAGVILTTGDATKVNGPNGGTDDFENSNGGPANTNLDKIVTPQTTHDASTLSFDFVPTNNKISFQFVFGSEEYNEFVGSNFNDVFAFFLNGKNIALIPGTTTPISINNVNGGNGPSNPAKNSQFFTDNITSSKLDTKLDGLVGESMAIFAQGDVTAGQTNHIEIAVADTSDSSHDSAVFLKASSFVDQPPPPPPPPPPTGIPLPAGVWAGMSMLGSLGVFSKFKKKH